MKTLKPRPFDEGPLGDDAEVFVTQQEIVSDL